MHVSRLGDLARILEDKISSATPARLRRQTSDISLTELNHFSATLRRNAESSAQAVAYQLDACVTGAPGASLRLSAPEHRNLAVISNAYMTALDGRTPATCKGQSVQRMVVLPEDISQVTLQLEARYGTELASGARVTGRATLLYFEPLNDPAPST